jgi:hypothetical protein
VPVNLASTVVVFAVGVGWLAQFFNAPYETADAATSTQSVQLGVSLTVQVYLSMLPLDQEGLMEARLKKEKDGVFTRHYFMDWLIAPAAIGIVAGLTLDIIAYGGWRLIWDLCLLAFGAILYHRTGLE